MNIKNKKQIWKIILLADIIISFMFIITAMFVESKLHHNFYAIFFWFLPLCFINTYIIGWKYIERTYYEIFKWKRIGMNFLIFLSTQLSIIFSLIQIIVLLNSKTLSEEGLSLSLIEVPIFVIIFVQIGDQINDYIKSKIGSDLKKIQSLQPKNAFILWNDTYVKVPISQVKVGDIIKVESDYIIPMDGILISKSALVDSQIINGENNGVKITYKDNVFAGMRNLSDQILIQSTCLLKDNLINKMVRKIQKIQTEKSGFQTIVDRMLVLFTPIVVVLAAIGFIISYFWLNASTDHKVLLSFQVLITVLVSACPCAIGISTPLAILIGGSRAAKKGVIFNKPEAFSKLNKITTIAFDKTGTLTKGEIQLTKYYGDKKYLSIIGAFETNIKHPIASGIIKYLHENNISHDVKIKSVDPEFMIFQFLSDHYEIVKYSNFKTTGDNPEINLHQTKNTCSLLFKNNNLVGQMIFDDELRENIEDKIQDLALQGFKTVMITGDNQESANKIAKILKINKVYANTTPDKKMLIIKEMQMNGEKVLFVGDGFNDALAINQADLSIAVIAKSTYLDLDADIALLDSNISLIVETINEVKNTKKIIYLNLFWAFTYNLVIIPLALFGVINPSIGMFAMFCSTILVLLNSLYFKLKK